MSTEATTTVGATKADPNLDKWFTEAKGVVSNLGTSDNALVQYMFQQFNSPDFNDNRRVLLQQLVESRANLSSLITNMMKTLADSIRQIVGNFR